MKSLSFKFGFILMSVVIFCPYNSFSEIEIKYDRFKNRTNVWTDPKKIGETVKQPALVLLGSYDGQTPSRPEICEIAFFIRSASWVYLHCHSLYCLADGKPVELPPSKHKGRVGKGYVLETISIMVPFSIVEQLSKCEKLEFKLCNKEFSLSRFEMEDLKTFVDAFQEKR